MKRIYLYAAALLAVALGACGDEPAAPDDPTTPPVEPQYPCVAKLTVTEYKPAPGQFVGEIPQWEAGDTYAEMLRKADETMARGGLVSLGAFGGYVTMRLGAPITDSQGPDFVVLGNAISLGAEPGIVEVSADGEQWYAIRGEHYDVANTVTVHYYRPDADATDSKFVKWECYRADGDFVDTGYLSRNTAYHHGPFFPQWGDPSASVFTVTGVRLPDNGTWNPDRRIFELAPYEGYADSYPNTDDRAALDIADALDASGNKAPSSIQYIRVTTGVLQNNGPLGECSTEVSGVMLLHD